MPQQAAKALAELGERLALARLRRKQSQRAWAQRLGVSVPTLASMERGEPGVSMGVYATALWIIGIVGLIAILTGPYGWVRRLRGGIANLYRSATTAVGDRAQDDDTLLWVARNVDGLRIAGYGLGALLLWFVDLSWLTFFFIAVIVAGWQVLVARLAIRGEELAAAAESGDDGSEPTEGADGETPPVPPDVVPAS